jgi:hypothetical protein
VAERAPDFFELRENWRKTRDEIFSAPDAAVFGHFSPDVARLDSWPWGHGVSDRKLSFSRAINDNEK